MSDTFGKTMASVVGGVGEKKLILTDTEGGTYTFKHDSRLPGNGLIHSVKGSLDSLVGVQLFATTLKTDEQGYAWCFRRHDGTPLAEVYWQGIAGGYYGEDYLEEDLALIG